MSIDFPQKPEPKPCLTANDKRQRHSEAQRKYRERNSELTRAKAREWMQRLRAGKRTAEERDAVAEKRRERDADYKQLSYDRKRNQKFVAKYGYNTFMDLFYPQFELQGKKHLPGLRLDNLARERQQELPTHWSEE